MKKFCGLLAAVLIASVMHCVAMANSGPAYWNNGPSFEPVALEESSLDVVEEELLFDFNDPDSVWGWSPAAVVTATYQMSWPKEQPAASVQMAFPLISSVLEISTEFSGVSVDGQPLDHQTFYGSAVYGLPYQNSQEDYLNHLDLEQVLKDVFDDTVALPSDNPAGTVYRLVPPAENCQVEVTIPDQVRGASAYGLSSYAGDDKQTVLGARFYDVEKDSLTFFLKGEPREDLTIEAYTIEEKQPLEKTAYKLETTRSTWLEWLLEGIRQYSGKSGIPLPEGEQWDRLFQQFQKETSQSQEIDLDTVASSLLRDDRLAVVLYTVDFQPGQQREMTVQYQMQGSMDRRETQEPVYTYRYLTNPAKRWNSFGKLTVRVIPPSEAMELVDSSIPLERQKDGSYQATLEELPEENIVFSFCERGDPTPKKDPYELLTGMLWLVVLALLALVVTLLLLRKQRRR